MSSHKIEYPKIIRITYFTPLFDINGVLTSEVPNTREFKTAHHAARWYAEMWNFKRWQIKNLPLIMKRALHSGPWDDKTDKLERRVKKIFKQYLL